MTFLRPPARACSYSAREGPRAVALTGGPLGRLARGRIYGARGITPRIGDGMFGILCLMLSPKLVY